MKRIFAVIRTRGADWRDGSPLEDQEAWDEHASFMDGLESEAFVALAGPLEGTRDVLIIVRAGTEDEIEERLAGDPWTRLGLLHTTRVTPWTLRIGSL
jgi:uncharacterized protein YciI